MRHADDTVKQELVERVDRSTARRMLACVRVMDPEQLSVAVICRDIRSDGRAERARGCLIRSGLEGDFGVRFM